MAEIFFLFFRRTKPTMRFKCDLCQVIWKGTLIIKLKQPAYHVEYFYQLDAAHSKCWLKYAFLKKNVKEEEKARKLKQNEAKKNLLHTNAGQGFIFQRNMFLEVKTCLQLQKGCEVFFFTY